MNKANNVILVNFLVILGIFSVFEGCSRIALWINERRLADKENRGVLVRSTVDYEMHPGVGHSHSKKDFDLSINSRKSVASNKVYTEKDYGDGFSRSSVLALGGSTTDPLATHWSSIEGTWPDFLGRDLLAFGLNSKVLNAGVAGASSSQELLRLITVLHEKNIDIAISYNGINEVYFSRVKALHLPENVLASNMVLKGISFGRIKLSDEVYSSSFVQMLHYGIRSMSLFKLVDKALSWFGFDSGESAQLANASEPIGSEERRYLDNAANVWMKNVQMMRAVADASSTEYLVFLQPVYGLGLLPAKPKNASTRHVSEINYLYKKLSAKCASIDYCVNLSRYSELNQDFSLYVDPRHFNARGNEKVSRIIAPVVAKKIQSGN